MLNNQMVSRESWVILTQKNRRICGRDEVIFRESEVGDEMFVGDQGSMGAVARPNKNPWGVVLKVWMKRDETRRNTELIRASKRDEMKKWCVVFSWLAQYLYKVGPPR